MPAPKKPTVIAKLRYKANLTQSQLQQAIAQKTGVEYSQASMSRLENRLQPLTIELAATLVQIFREHGVACSLEDLLAEAWPTPTQIA